MTTLLALLMAGGVVAALGLVFLFPLLLVIGIVAAAAKLVFLVLFLPIRMLGFIAGAVAGLIALLLRGFIMTGIVALLLLLGLVPLLPVALIGLAIWWIVRAARRGSAPAAIHV